MAYKKKHVISYLSPKIYVLGTEKDHLNEHPKHMFKMMGKTIWTVLYPKFCSAKFVLYVFKETTKIVKNMNKSWKFVKLCKILTLYFFIVVFSWLIKSVYLVIQLFVCSTLLSMICIMLIHIMLINVKMPTIVSILTFMSMINTSWRLKERLSWF